MAGSLDYMRWRGDLSFEDKPFNSVDASLFSSLIYLPVDKSATDHTLSDVAELLYNLPSFQNQMHGETEAEILLLPNSPRFGNVKILNWTNQLRKTPAPLQFTAATFRINRNIILIAYRGTDSSMIGWNEDMNMNYKPEIYGQNVAALYLNSIAKSYPNDQIILTGHSKGGNFAQYALSAAKPDLQARIIKAYSFDGPGFFSKVFTNPGFVKAMPKMKTYLPEGSIIGTMLDHPERVLIVTSDVSMQLQHDPRRWNVGRDSFVLAPGLTADARVLRHALINFNHSIPNKKRGEMFSALFDAFENSNIKNINQLTANKVLGTYRLGRIIMSLEPTLRKYLVSVFTDIWNSYRLNLTLPFSEGPFSLFPKSNDSKKAPIFYKFYDTATPSLKLPDEVYNKLNPIKENKKNKKSKKHKS